MFCRFQKCGSVICRSESSGLLNSRLGVGNESLSNFVRRSISSGETGGSAKKLTRTERRLLERKRRNKGEKEMRKANRVKEKSLQDRAIAPASKIRQRVISFFHPRVPGINVQFRRDHLIALGYRIPFFLALCYLSTNEDCSPYVIQGSLGPSMLPTIQFIGDLWLVETGAWYRLLGWQPNLEVGDIVLWKDPSTARSSCKRIIGVEGDEIRRYGEYAHLYSDRDDLAIVWPRHPEERNLDSQSPWDPLEASNSQKEPLRTMTVPPGHIWLEGDCPPFSLDSRHYGPIPISWVRGRLILRLWPLLREDDAGKYISAWVSRNRPIPFPSVDQYLGKRFNFYRVPKGNTPKDDPI